MEAVEVSPPYDISDITALMAVRAMVMCCHDGETRPHWWKVGIVMNGSRHRLPYGRGSERSVTEPRP